MPFDRCVVKKRLVSPKEGMILTEWSKFQYALTLDAPDVQYIRQACFPRMSMERMRAQGTYAVVRDGFCSRMRSC
ncbi:MAG: hypothetical protein ACLUB2_04325 [Butyricicoccus pullicaecorum]